jgi:hypothetical protein
VTLRFGRRFDRAKSGRLVVALAPEEVDVLRQLAGELTDLFENPQADDAARDRLFPHAYLDPTEEDAEAEWQRLVHPDLVDQRLAALRLLVDTLPASTPSRGGRVETELDEEQETAWLGVLNDARLALGSRLGVTEEYDVDDVARDDPLYVAWNIYGWLTGLQGELVQVLLGGVREP